MSRWSDPHENHAIHATLRQANDWIETETEDPSSELEDERRRLRKVIGNIMDVVNDMDPEFYPLQLLDQLNSHLSHQNFRNQLQTYASAPDSQYLRVANDHVTQYANQVYHLAAMVRPPESKKAIRAAEKAYESFAAAMDARASKNAKRIEENESELQTLSEKMTLLVSKVETLEQDVDEKQSEWETEFSSEQNTRAEEYTAAQTERAEEHSKNQISRNSTFEELLNDWTKKSEAQTSTIARNYKSRLEAHEDAYRERSKKILDDMDAKHKAVIELHELVANDSVAGGYQKSANNELKAANLWRWISMGALLSAVAWLAVKYIWGFTPMKDGTINWPQFVTAISITALLVAMSGYASRQSKLHRDSEKRMRWFSLETKAIDPFIASLSDDQQREIKAKLIERMFGQNHNSDGSKPQKTDEALVKNVAESVTDLAKEAINKISTKG